MHSASKALPQNDPYIQAADCPQLFQLRSIEQNDLAIVADSQNKAILIFTGVTIVFLPLSFCASYFGMNLKGIIDTNRSERYFWELCGTVGLLIVLSVSAYAFRHAVLQVANLRRMPILWRSRRYPYGLTNVLPD